MKLITWNIDGLCDNHTLQRTKNALDIIITNTPDIIFLQEVISSTETIITERLLSSGYLSATPPPAVGNYFTMTYYKASTVKPMSSKGKRVHFTGTAKSHMVRILLQ